MLINKDKTMDIETLIQIYLHASKVGLEAQKDFVKEWTERMLWQMMVDGFQNKPFSSVITFICDQTKIAVKNNGWDTYDPDGVSWFLALYSESYSKCVSRRYSYDIIFSDCFRRYFRDQDLNAIYMKKLSE